MKVKEPKTVSLFVTCLVDQLFPQVGVSVVNILNHFGLTVDFPKQQTCCGQLAFNNGYHDQAREVAEHFLASFKHSDYIITPSGSCTSMIKTFYPSLFPTHSELQTHAKRIADNTFEFSQFLVDILEIRNRRTRVAAPTRVTFHDACHALRELGISQAPRTLIEGIEGVELIESEGHSSCCGFGGTFSVKYPEISNAILQDKIEHIRDSRADYVVSVDSSCLMQIGTALSRQGIQTKPIHLAELIATSLGNGDDSNQD